MKKELIENTEYVHNENGILKIKTLEENEIAERSFKGVWIPKEIWIDNNLTWMEKLFLVEIDSLDNDKGCYASNKYFSAFFNLSNGRCSQIINSLIKKEYLLVKYKKQNNQIINRTLKVSKFGIKFTKEVFNKLKGGIKNTKSRIKNTKGGYLENDKGINISINKQVINSINNNTANPPLLLEVFNYWNLKKIKVHRKISTVEKELNKKDKLDLKKITLEDIKKAIDNYAICLKGDKYWWTYEWALWTFIKKIDRFLDENDPLKNLLKNNNSNKKELKESGEKTKIINGTSRTYQERLDLQILAHENGFNDHVKRVSNLLEKPDYQKFLIMLLENNKVKKDANEISIQSAKKYLKLKLIEKKDEKYVIVSDLRSYKQSKRQEVIDQVKKEFEIED